MKGPRCCRTSRGAQTSRLVDARNSRDRPERRPPPLQVEVTMKMLKLDEIQQRAGALAKVLDNEPSLVGRSLRELALLIEGLARAQLAGVKTPPRRRK